MSLAQQLLLRALVAWFWDNSDDKTHPAGQLKPNAWGFLDMLGNAAEWVVMPDGKMAVAGGPDEQVGPACRASDRQVGVPGQARGVEPRREIRRDQREYRREYRRDRREDRRDRRRGRDD